MSTDLHHEIEQQRSQAGLCAAYGCPFPGTCSSSTTGTTEWFCSMHNSSDSSRTQAITAVLRANAWLVNAILDCRKYRKGDPQWPHVFARIYGDIDQAQRPELQWKKPESRMLWLMRLESALMAIVREVADKRQPALPGVGNHQPIEPVNFDYPA